MSSRVDDQRSSHTRRNYSRSRSRSPYRASHTSTHRHKRRRTEDTRDDAPRKSKPIAAARLPFHAQHISKHDFDTYYALFGLYLDVQKEIRIEDLEEKEVKGRWKSFLGKWNRGELAEGWYDPATKRRADEAAVSSRVEGERSLPGRRSPSQRELRESRNGRDHELQDESDDDEFGPSLPTQAHQTTRAGPSIPNAQDLSLAAELRAEDDAQALKELRYERKADRNMQKERLEELVPRADPGSRERQLEKKREVAATNAGFREAKEGGEVEMRDSDLMGGDEDGVAGYKAKKKEMERKKNERELRKEEQLRARIAEREERLKAAREKESKTMDYLKALAKEKWG